MARRTPLIAMVLVVTHGFFTGTPRAGGPPAREHMRESVREIHTFEWFKSRCRARSRHPDLITQANYERFIDLQTDEYSTAFDAAEMETLAACLSSPLGQRFLVHRSTTQAWDRFVTSALPLRPPGDNVTLAFDDVAVIWVREYLMETTGMGVAIHPRIAGHRFTLISDEVVSRREALNRVLDALREEGLRVEFVGQALIIGPGA